MPSLNKVQIIGHTGKKPELRQTTGGKSVTKLSVAVNYGTGEKEQTEWFSVNVWDKAAEDCVKYLDKGQLVYVEGRLQTRVVEGKNGGDKRYFTEVFASRVLFLGGAPKAKQGDPSKASAPLYDDDVPF